MARGGEMQVVELDDAPDAVPDEADDQPRRVRWRRPVAVGGVVALVGAALAGGQWVVDARERSAIAALEGIPGVIAPIEGDLRVLRTVTQAELGDQFGGVGDVTSAPDGSQAYEWDDPESGATLWTAPLLGPTPRLAHDESDGRSLNVSTNCQPGAHADEQDDTSPAGRVICLVSNGGMLVDADYLGTEVPGTTTRLVILDTGDGSVVTDRRVGPAANLAVVPGLAVVATLVDGAPAVTAYDLASGDEAWRRDLPASAVSADDAAMGMAGVFVSAAGERFVVQSPVNRVTLLSREGQVLRDLDADVGRSIDDWWVDPATGRLLYSTSSSGTASTVTLVTNDRDLSKDVEIVGSHVYFTVDDGSLPGIVLTGGQQLQAWDSASGSASWSTDDDRLSAADSAIVLRGDVFVIAGSILAAIDGRTGEVLWSTPLDAGGYARRMLTDGRSVVVELDNEQGGALALVSYDRTSGEVMSRSPIPGGFDQVFPDREGRLIGYDPESEHYVVLG